MGRDTNLVSVKASSRGHGISDPTGVVPRFLSDDQGSRHKERPVRASGIDSDAP